MSHQPPPGSDPTAVPPMNNGAGQMYTNPQYPGKKEKKSCDIIIYVCFFVYY